MTANETLGRNIQTRLAANRAAGVRPANRQQLAIDARLTWPNVSRIVRGKQWPAGETLAAIAEALQCTPADLLAGD